MKKCFGLFGCGGMGKETIPFVSKFKNDEIKFIDDMKKVSKVNGIEVISKEEYIRLKASKKYFNISISDSVKRKKISDFLISKNCIPHSISAPTSIMYNDSTIEHGSILCDYSIIAPNAKIGKFFHCNRFSQVSHDCVIGDYVTFAPQVNCSGNVHVHDFAYIGTGALIKHGTEKNPIIIGEGAIVGMGAVVTKNVDPYTTVIGNPAKDIKK